jgi:NAD(P)H dehydrogenase (quinone)
MRVLTVYAHPNPASFCHALLERFTKGLADAGHESEVVDLYAIEFNPVYGMDDYTFFAHESVPPEILGGENEMREQMVAEAGGPIRRAVAKRWLRDKRLPELLEVVARRRPKDVLAQQEKVAAADGLAFIAPIYWMNFPAILRGWVERVFTYGFVYAGGDATRREYLQRAYRLGHEFEPSPKPAPQPETITGGVR